VAIGAEVAIVGSIEVGPVLTGSLKDWLHVVKVHLGDVVLSAISTSDTSARGDLTTSTSWLSQLSLNPILPDFDDLLESGSFFSDSNSGVGVLGDLGKGSGCKDKEGKASGGENVHGF
jgi:hypothetical protein